MVRSFGCLALLLLTSCGIQLPNPPIKSKFKVGDCVQGQYYRAFATLKITYVDWNTYTFCDFYGGYCGAEKNSFKFAFENNFNLVNCSKLPAVDPYSDTP
jgi:hypothetical protein